MSNFAQKHTRICTFYLLTDRNPRMETELMQYSRWKKAVLIIPLLASEYTLQENRPVLENIARQLSSAQYLSQIIFGLDRASGDEALMLSEILKDSGVKNYLIQHNDGKGFSSIYQKLSEAGFGFQTLGKGRNMFMSFGIALALGAQTIGIIDADIRTFHRMQLDRLFYPVQVLNYQFSKAFYARLKKGFFYGRVKRLLLDPLLISLKRKFTETQEEKVLRLVDFLLHINYQLSGEVVFDSQLLTRMQFATNWGVEIFTLIEVYRKATSCAQVEISHEPFDHKHQPASEADRTKGLYRMGIDVVTTLLSALVIEEGLEISEHFIRDLTTTYLSVADDLIKMYADNAAFCGLSYDEEKEEFLVDRVFKNVILYAGDLLLSPSFLVNRFSSYVSEHEDFKPFIEKGLLSTIEKMGEKIRTDLYETPKTVSWDRVLRKLPAIIHEIIDVVEEEKVIYR
jgi:glucosyl-3-phosphoglycerate synthase